MPKLYVRPAGGVCACALLFLSAAAPACATTIPLTRTGLTGVPSEGGTVGRGWGQADDFDVGRYIVVNGGLVLRARTQIENGGKLGSPTGNVGVLCVEKRDKGIGVGPLLHNQWASKGISGGGKSGLEAVSFIFDGDPLLAEPAPVLAGRITVQVNKFKAKDDDLTLTLFDAFGGVHSFGPSIVEPLLRSTGRRERWDLDLSSLPGIGNIGALARFDVRSGILLPSGKLSGGHFYVSGIDVAPIPEPASLALLLAGAAVLGVTRPRRRGSA